MNDKITTYIRLLSYSNALKVVNYINKNEFGYANISPGCVSMTIQNTHFKDILNFVISLNVRHSFDEEPAFITEERMIESLKQNGEIG